jgi:hypothetical protein
MNNTYFNLILKVVCSSTAEPDELSFLVALVAANLTMRAIEGSIINGSHIFDEFTKYCIANTINSITKSLFTNSQKQTLNHSIEKYFNISVVESLLCSYGNSLVSSLRPGEDSINNITSEFRITAQIFHTNSSMTGNLKIELPLTALEVLIGTKNDQINLPKEAIFKSNEEAQNILLSAFSIRSQLYGYERLDSNPFLYSYQVFRVKNILVG